MTTWRDAAGREVRGFRREGTHVCLWPIHVAIWQKSSQYCNYPPIKRKRKLRSSLLAQRLEFQAFTAVAWFQSLVGKLPQTVQHGQKKEIKK